MKDHPIYRACAWLLFIILTITILYVARSFFIPLTLGIFFSFLLYPISRKLEKWRFPRALAIILSLFVAFVVLAGFIYFFSTQISSFAEDLPLLKDRVNQKISDFQSFVEKTTHINEQRQGEYLKNEVNRVFSEGGMILLNIFSATGTFLAAMGLLPIYIFFLTFYRDKFSTFMIRVFPASSHPQMLEIMTRVSKVTQKYLTGLFLDILILSVLNGIGFLILGLNHAILLAVVVSILNIIPYIGVLIGSLFPITLALITKDSIWYAVGAAGVCVAVQFLDNNLITPKVVGSSVSVNPLSTLMALLIGGMIWGIAGMMLFIPLIGMLKVVLDNFETTNPYGYLIGDEKPAGGKEFEYIKRKLERIKEP